MEEKVRNLKKTIVENAESKYHVTVLTSFIENLDEVLGERFNKAENFTNEVGETVINSIDEIKTTVEQLENMISQISTEKEEISKVNLEVIERLRAAGKDLTGAREEVKGFMKRVSKTLESFREVIDMTKQINDIAKKTNMLSINAAIEAARAREYGRGFAVVAEEVQKLSIETNTNAKKINERVNELAREFKEVLEQIGNISELFDIIAVISENALKILNKNEEFLERLVGTLEDSKNQLGVNVEDLLATKDRIKALISNISTMNRVIKNVLEMQQRIKEVKI